MSNCDVGSGGFGLPGDVVAQHGVEGCNHLAHDGDDDDFGLFVGGGETIVEDFESGIVSASAQSLLSISATRVSALFQRASSSPATNRLAASAAL